MAGVAACSNLLVHAASILSKKLKSMSTARVLPLCLLLAAYCVQLGCADNADVLDLSSPEAFHAFEAGKEDDLPPLEQRTHYWLG
jgi:hypothetical protein